MLQREEKNIRSQTKFKLSCHDKVTVYATSAREVVLTHIVSNCTVTIRNICTKILLDIQNKIILKSYLEFLFKYLSNHLSKLFCFFSFTRISNRICSCLDNYIPRWKEMFMVATKRQERFWISISVILRKWQRT